MRNPLNSIVAHNIEKKHLYQELEALIIKLREEVKNDKMMNKFIKSCF
jgi:hypothetical protein